MKPDVSLIPERDKSVEARKPLTKRQRAQLALDQKGLCGCGCGGKLDHAGEGTVDEHLQALGQMGTNDLENRSLWRKPCSDTKTYGTDLPAIAKSKAMAGETGQWARRQKNGPKLKSGPTKWPQGRKLQSRGFDKRR